jgi:hypothetical protein
MKRSGHNILMADRASIISSYENISPLKLLNITSNFFSRCISLFHFVFQFLNMRTINVQYLYYFSRSKGYFYGIYYIFYTHSSTKYLPLAYLYSCNESHIASLKWSIVTKSGKNGKISSILTRPSHSLRKAIACFISFLS